jgi:hypothetical protein
MLPHEFLQQVQSFTEDEARYGRAVTAAGYTSTPGRQQAIVATDQARLPNDLVASVQPQRFGLQATVFEASLSDDDDLEQHMVGDGNEIERVKYENVSHNVVVTLADAEGQTTHIAVPRVAGHLSIMNDLYVRQPSE